MMKDQQVQLSSKEVLALGMGWMPPSRRWPARCASGWTRTCTSA